MDGLGRRRQAVAVRGFDFGHDVVSRLQSGYDGVPRNPRPVFAYELAAGLFHLEHSPIQRLAGFRVNLLDVKRLNGGVFHLDYMILAHLNYNINGLPVHLV